MTENARVIEFNVPKTINIGIEFITVETSLLIHLQKFKYCFRMYSKVLARACFRNMCYSSWNNIWLTHVCIEANIYTIPKKQVFGIIKQKERLLFRLINRATITSDNWRRYNSVLLTYLIIKRYFCLFFFFFLRTRNNYPN